MRRRRFVQVLTGSFVYSMLGACARSLKSRSRYEFRHGVASGDPLADSVILWTRISGAVDETIQAHWQVATDPDMRSIVQRGKTKTGPDQDYTVKVDVTGLPSGQQFYYRFQASGTASPLGMTRTLPAGAVDAARFAVVTCSNFPYGYFHAYQEIAKRGDIDAVIHLGDYIYDYGMGEYATEYAEQLGRVPDPLHEIKSLSDYRRRHAQYKTDGDLQAMHAAHPVISVWDDHEISNDAWSGGAENHNEEEGSWADRVQAATQAYVEWMPIRVEAQGSSTRIFRQFQFGDLLSLIMLDTRLYARDPQPVIDLEMTDEEINGTLDEPGRQMLGTEQSDWLRGSLERAKDTTWQVIGQQVLVSDVRAPDLEPLVDREQPSAAPPEMLDHSIMMSKRNPPLLVDTWGGYNAARQSLLADLKAGAANPVFLSGDLHTSVAGNLIPNGEDKPVAVEFMTTSVTSPGFAEYLPEREPGAIRDATMELNPHIAYMETERRGWLCMTFTKSECVGEWHLLDGVQSRKYTVDIDRRLRVRAGSIADGLRESPA